VRAGSQREVGRFGADLLCVARSSEARSLAHLGPSQTALDGLVPHLRLQLLEEILDHDQLTRFTQPAIPNRPRTDDL